MAEPYDTRGARRRALAAERDAEFFPLNGLPNDVLVSVFAAAEDPTWVRHTFPLVCRAWNELYRTKGASPLHETLEVDFERARKSAVAAAMAREAGGRRVPAPGFSPLVHASSVISWAERRAGSVRKLRLKNRGVYEALKYFTASDLAALVAVAASSLTDISIGPGFGDLCERPFWESLRTSVVPAGRLRSFVAEKIDAESFGSDVEPLLGQLAGSLEELVLETCFCGDPFEMGLPRFPESLFALKELRHLALTGHKRITAIPAGISSLKKLKELKVAACNLSSLPKELGELSGLTSLTLGGNWNQGTALLSLTLGRNWNLGTALPADEAFPADLGKMKCLRELELSYCRLRTVPSFVGELKSLESLTLDKNDLSSLPKELGELSGLTKLDLSYNRRLGTTLPVDEAFPAELGNMKCLRELDLSYCSLRTVPAFVGQLKSLGSLALCNNGLSSLPKELSELSGLTKLDLASNINLGSLPESETFFAELGKLKSLQYLNLQTCGLRAVPSFVGELALKVLRLSWNEKLGDAPEDEAFPAALGKLKSLRELDLIRCRLRVVPSFVGELESLESLHLSYNDNLQIDAPLDFLIEGCPRLRSITLKKDFRGVPWTPKSLANLEAFKAKLLAKNPDAEVHTSRTY